jgi:hypothetical protein
MLLSNVVGKFISRLTQREMNFPTTVFKTGKGIQNYSFLRENKVKCLKVKKPLVASHLCEPV